MTKPKALIIRTAGTNCDYETQAAFGLAGASAERVHINELIAGNIHLADYQIMAIPGGFSYGDDIASGKILANELKYKLGDLIREFDLAGKPVIGICNGFQVLVKMGILPGDKYYSPLSTLTFNDSDKFECRWVFLKTISNLRSQISDKSKAKTKTRTKTAECFWAKGMPDIIQLPVAHGEGKFVALNDAVLKDMENSHQVVFRYADKHKESDAYPLNPNGSAHNIAGICNLNGNVFGLMPHPERCIYRWQNPAHDTSYLDDDGYGWGLQIFKNAVKHVK